MSADPSPTGHAATASPASAPAAGPSAAPPAEPDAGQGATRATPGSFRERFDSLLPEIQRQWPEVARHTLEATRGSFDDLAHTLAGHSGRTVSAVKQQLLELAEAAGDQTGRLADQLQPLEAQLESLLDELNATLRPRIEKPVRERPLMALGIAAGVGVVLGLLLASGRRSA
jgi:ElaB/YqjD/DUF883 family membrane-anchored ribosome-binding protein